MKVRAIAELKVEVADLTSSSPIAVMEQTQEDIRDKQWQWQNDLKRLGSPGKAHNMDMDLPAVQQQHNPPAPTPRTDTDTSTKLDHSVLGIATTATVGLYLYKKRRPAMNVKAKHSVPDQMEEIV